MEEICDKVGQNLGFFFNCDKGQGKCVIEQEQ